MKKAISVFHDLVRDYMDAVNLYTEAAVRHEETAGSGDDSRFQFTREDMLRRGGDVSFAYGRLQGFVEALLSR
jgi:hypothetical protein